MTSITSTFTKRLKPVAGGVVVTGVLTVFNMSPPQRHVSETALTSIATAEYPTLTVYPDPATHGRPYTGGVGATIGLDGKPLRPGTELSVEDVVALYARDVTREERCIIEHFDGDRIVHTPTGWRYVMPQSVFDQLVSVEHTVGCNRLTRNRNGKQTGINKAALAHDWENTCNHITDWIYANGKINKGLHARRIKEKALCREGL